MYKILLTASLFLFLSDTSVAQTFSNPGFGDSLFPVTGRYYQYISGSEATDYPYTTFGLFKTGGKYIVHGAFQNWSDNDGSSLIIDTTSNQIINRNKWRINGIVRTAVPDGSGGFFIGGDFTRIGDSSRKYFAQINASGQPTSWKPIVDSFVNVIRKRNDTLFIGGYFSNFGGLPKLHFAMCRTNGTNLYHGTNTAFTNLNYINDILLNKDTMIFGGKAVTNYENVRKYNFKNYSTMAWATPFTDYSEVKHIQISSDGSTVIYAANFNGDFIKAVSNGTGIEVYYYNISLGGNTGHVKGMKLVSNKVFVYGDFINQQNLQNYTLHKGLFTMNGTTGEIYSDDLNLNGFVSFMHIENNKIFISGKFSSVNNIARNQFASLDASTLTLNNWQLSISDPLTSLCFGNSNRAFIAGNFSGMNVVPKNALAAIDSASHSVTAWNPSIPQMGGSTKRMFVRGDSLFMLAVRAPYSGCQVQSETTFKIFSLLSGNEYGTGNAPTQNMNDMLLDSNYLYISHGFTLRRYLLPALIYDAGWGTDWQFSGYSHALFRLFADSTKIYAIGDSRYTTCASSLEAKRGFVDVYNKATGQVLNYFPFEGANHDYDVILFKEAELCKNRMYIQGQFAQLNGVNRHNFACINVNTGTVTNWNPSFTVLSEKYSFSTPTKLTQCNGRIWFAGGPQLMSDGSYFRGFGGIDTLTAYLTQPIKTRLRNNNNSLGGYVYDFIVSETDIAIAGSFDSANTKPYSNFAVFTLTGINTVQFCTGSGNSFTSDVTGLNYQWQLDNGSGFTDISNNSNFSGTQTPTLQLTNIPSTWYGYTLRCRVDANYSDIFEIRFKNVWTGAVNSLWENPGNWQCGMVPDSNTDVIINNGPVLLNANTTIRSMLLLPGVILTVVQGVNLTILH